MFGGEQLRPRWLHSRECSSVAASGPTSSQDREDKARRDTIYPSSISVPLQHSFYAFVETCSSEKLSMMTRLEQSRDGATLTDRLGLDVPGDSSGLGVCCSLAKSQSL